MSNKVQVSVEMKHSMFADPTITVRFDERFISSGPTSIISWENRDVMPALRQMLHMKAHEILTGIEITREGITARITTLEAKT